MLHACRGWTPRTFQSILVQPHTAQQSRDSEHDLRQVAWQTVSGATLLCIGHLGVPEDSGGYAAEEVAADLVSESNADILGSELCLNL